MITHVVAGNPKSNIESESSKVRIKDESSDGESVTITNFINYDEESAREATVPKMEPVNIQDNSCKNDIFVKLIKMIYRYVNCSTFSLNV